MATVNVSAPVEGFAGEVAGVTFVDGTAEVDTSQASALAYFRRHGYTVSDGTPKRPRKSKAATATGDGTPGDDDALAELDAWADAAVSAGDYPDRDAALAALGGDA
jgi:hypothetical protein